MFVMAQFGINSDSLLNTMKWQSAFSRKEDIGYFCNGISPARLRKEYLQGASEAYLYIFGY